MDAIYNLRSSKWEDHIPVQLQLVKDDDILAETLASSRAVQVSDSEHSDDSLSDIDISALLNHSDKKLSSPSVDSVKGAGAGGSGLSASGSGGRGSNGSVSQNDINQIILSLSSLGERLDSMEKNYVKGLPKTNDVSKVKTIQPIKSNVLKHKPNNIGLI